MVNTAKQHDRGGKPAIALRLKALRDAAGLNQKQLAAAAGVAISVVFKIEQGVRPDPSWNTVQALARALGVDCRAFADDAGGKVKVKPAPAAARSKPRKSKPAGGGGDSEVLR